MDLSGNSVDVSLVKNEVSVSPELRSKGSQGTQITGLLRKLVCDHQGAIVEHIYWAAEVHKDLRLALETGNKNAIKVKLAEIDNDLPALFQNSWQATVYALNTYFAFSHKSTTLPRMCIKATSTIDNSKRIVDVFREDGGTSKLTYEVPENTGFLSVQNDGKYYKCDNIPNAASSGDYKNPRLDEKLAKRYKQNIADKFKERFSKQYFDQSWAECWTDYEPEKENSASCYKSTLVLPMTLMNNRQSSNFVQNTMVGVSKDARSIYGFLCFDHVETEYFNDDDVNIGYVVADLLSFYMINELNFTTYSKVYEDAKKEI